TAGAGARLVGATVRLVAVASRPGTPVRLRVKLCGVPSPCAPAGVTWILASTKSLNAGPELGARPSVDRVTVAELGPLPVASGSSSKDRRVGEDGTCQAEADLNVTMQPGLVVGAGKDSGVYHGTA